MSDMDKKAVDTEAFVQDVSRIDSAGAPKSVKPKVVSSIHFDKASIDDISEITEFAETQLMDLGCPMKSVIQINIAIDELYSNIVKYGYEGETGPATVKLLEKEDPPTVYVRFEDEGIPYNPLESEDPDVTLSAEERNIGGLGIFMVKKTMDDIRYKYEDGKNILTLKKLL